MIKMIRIFLVITYICCMTACSGFFDKDNTPAPTPLTGFKTETGVTNRFYVKANQGVKGNYLKLGPAVTQTQIFSADKNGTVTAFDRFSGKKQWQVNLRAPISAGPTADEHIVVIGTRDGDIIALHNQNGSQQWRSKTISEIHAKPTIYNDTVLVKAIDGRVSAFSKHDGARIWNFQQTEPSLILRGASSIKTKEDGMLVAGFANGNLIKLTIDNGSLQWQTAIARPNGSFAIQRMIDIDADPFIHESYVYAATYQGKIAALEYFTGKLLWTHDISSYTGMTVDNQNIYISDADSVIWSFNQTTGQVNWRQTDLKYRNVTAPILMGRFLVVGDVQGYLHWLNIEDGHLAARIRVNHSGILATPVSRNGILYVVTIDGHLAAYALT